MKAGLLAVCLFVPVVVRADALLPLGELDQVTVKEVPAYTAIEAEVTGPVETIWEKGYRQDARYVAEVHGVHALPVVIIYPEWEGKPPQSPSRILVQLVLDTKTNPEKLPDPDMRDKGLKISEMPAVTIVGCAYRGPYTVDNFKKALARINDYIQKKDLKPLGPPRHLYFSNTAWTPAFMRVSEVEVPVAGGANGPMKPAAAQ